MAADQRARLEQVNAPGLVALRDYLKSGEAVAFLGAGASASLYPLWAGLIGELVDAAVGRLGEAEAATCRALAGSAPEDVVEIVRRSLGGPSYHAVLREVLRVRTDPVTGRSWTAVQELVCRCAFRGVVTTNYDPGIVDARMRVRPGASATGFMTWQDELGLDEWRTGRVFGGAELPVLYAHGIHTQPDSVVLAASDYRRAYAGKLAQVLERLTDGGHLCWIGFSFADQRLAAILREVPLLSGTRHEPGAAPAHVAVMPWDPGAEANDPGVLAQRAEIAYGAQVILYPAPGGDHSALAALLAGMTDAGFPPAVKMPARPASAQAGSGVGIPGGRGAVAVRWVPPPDPVAHFTGRAEELARLDRWAADPEVRLIGVSAWGGSGKTTLVTHWAGEGGGIARRPGLQGVFGWSFYTNPSAEHWTAGFLEWVQHDLSVRVPQTGRLTERVLGVLAAIPVLLVLDGLEVMQEGPAAEGFGRLLDGLVRDVLIGACLMNHGGLVVLTSRFPFADLEGFDGSSARMLELPAFTPAEGAALLATAGGGWLGEAERREMVAAVDGHALAVSVLAGLLAGRLPSTDLAALRADLSTATRTDVRVGKVLQFYAGRLTEPDRYLLAAVSLFARPVDAAAVLAVTAHDAFGGHLAGWTPDMVETAVTIRLGGLASWHPNGTVSAHPLVRDTFRPLVMAAAKVATEVALTGLPEGRVASRADALRVVEAIELLLDAGQWESGDELYHGRTGGLIWTTLAAPRLGQRAATAFASPSRRDACLARLGPTRLAFYLNEIGERALFAGDLEAAQSNLPQAVSLSRQTDDASNLSASLANLSLCLAHLGDLERAQDTAAETLRYAQRIGGPLILVAYAELGWILGLHGDSTASDEQFKIADQLSFAHERRHMHSLVGALWAESLIRTGRLRPAKILTIANRNFSRRNRRTPHVARCDRALGRISLAEGDTEAAGAHLAAAAECFRDSGYLGELAVTLADLAEYTWAARDLDAAERYATEAITIASPRGLIPALSSGLAARARICADQANPDRLFQGRDAADAALRLATGRHLAWHQFDALRAHVALDQAEGIDRGWAAQAGAMRARLVPPDLDPDPLASVEQQVAAQMVAEREADDTG
jgi:tetratricopeptide (TPR) repeat protein